MIVAEMLRKSLVKNVSHEWTFNKPFAVDTSR